MNNQLHINDRSRFPISVSIYGVTVANHESARFVKKLAPLTLVGLSEFVTLHLSCKLPAALILSPTNATYSLIKQLFPGPSWHEGTGYTASFSMMRMYVWFPDAEVDVVLAEVDVEVEEEAEARFTNPLLVLAPDSSMYISRRFPAPQYSYSLPGHANEQSETVVLTDPALGDEPQ